MCLAALLVTKSGIYPLALALGCVIACVQSVSNLLVLYGSDAQNRSRNFCGLHLMFGIGSFFAPLAAAQVAAGGLRWQQAIALAAAVFAVVTILTLVTIPAQPGAAKKKTAEMVHFDGQKLAVLAIFLLYTSAQVLHAQWMTTYLPATGKVTAATAATYLSAYFVVVTVSRLLAFVFLNERREDLVMNGAIGLSTICLVAGHYWPVALVAAGVQAPFYPIFLAKMSKRFASCSERITLYILVSAQAGLVLSHSLVGGLTDRLGITDASWLPAVAMGLAGLGSVAFARRYQMLAPPLKGPVYAYRSNLRLIGTKGDVFIDRAYAMKGAMTLTLTKDGRPTETVFPANDQFGAELAYFSSCIQANQPPQPSALEGLADVRWLRALQESSQTCKVVERSAVVPERRPDPSQAINFPPPPKPQLFGVTDPF